MASAATNGCSRSPFGVGMKYSFRRWLAGRIEFTDQFSWGDHGVATQHNLVLNFGLECRFGGQTQGLLALEPQPPHLVDGDCER